MFEEEKAIHQTHHSLLLEETIIARLEQIYNTRAHRVSADSLTSEGPNYGLDQLHPTGL